MFVLVVEMFLAVFTHYKPFVVSQQSPSTGSGRAEKLSLILLTTNLRKNTQPTDYDGFRPSTETSTKVTFVIFANETETSTA